MDMELCGARCGRFARPGFSRLCQSTDAKCVGVGGVARNPDMLPFQRASPRNRARADALQFSIDASGLVPEASLPSDSPAKISAMAAADRLRKESPPSRNGDSRRLAIRRLAAHVPGPAVSLRVKHSVAVLVRGGSRILSVRRPEDDDELPGVWGVPAGTFKELETLEALVERIGRDKLGAGLRPVRKLATGYQDRPGYRLEMELWEAEMDGLPTRREWKWCAPDVLIPGRDEGSLCCELVLETEQGGRS